MWYGPWWDRNGRARLSVNATADSEPRQRFLGPFEVALAPTALAEMSMQPHSGVSPIALGSSERNSEGLGRLGHAEAGEITKLDDARGEWVVSFQTGQRLIHR